MRFPVKPWKSLLWPMAKAWIDEAEWQLNAEQTSRRLGHLAEVVEVHVVEGVSREGEFPEVAEATVVVLWPSKHNSDLLEFLDG